MNSSRYLRRILAAFFGIYLHWAYASSFETQQPNTAIFDGILGETGQLILDTSQTRHQWTGSAQKLNSEGFAFRKLTGDFHLTAQFESAANINFGFQISPPNSKQASDALFRCAMDKRHLLAIDTNLRAISRLKPVSSADTVKLERQNNQLILYAAKTNHVFSEVGRWDIGEKSELLVGVYRQFLAQESTALMLKNWRWVIPIWSNFIPYRDYIGSRLEVLDVHTGERRVVYETPAGIEAPNWSSDGDYIIYDAGGRVYRLHLPSKKVALINTGFAVRNNNDHVVTFQNKYLGLTHLDQDSSENWSIYKLPFSGGGEPIQLTHKTPAYLHSWSPDGSKILFTALRNGQFDIFQTTADGNDVEVQLTNTPELDDGPEYAPDGKFIYFNRADESGMHIWRMDADGKNPKQLTRDGLRDWFPHVSPDGQSLVFMSYQNDVKPDQHPYYQPIYLRQLNLKTGKICVIAYLYGGQGTINVPSWSSDSRYIAFVSNTQLGTQIKH